MDSEDLRQLILDRKARSTKIAKVNSFFYNGSVAVVLACTALATFASVVWTSDSIRWIAPLLTSIATILVGIGRSLQFGARWVHFYEAAAKYDSALVKLATIDFLDEKARAEELVAIRKIVSEIPLDHASIPGIGSMN